MHQYQFRPRRAAPKQDTVLTVSSLESEIKWENRSTEWKGLVEAKYPVLHCSWIFICLLSRHNEFVSCVVICIGQCPHPCLSILHDVLVDGWSFETLNIYEENIFPRYGNGKYLGGWVVFFPGFYVDQGKQQSTAVPGTATSWNRGCKSFFFFWTHILWDFIKILECIKLTVLICVL